MYSSEASYQVEGQSGHTPLVKSPLSSKSSVVISLLLTVHPNVLLLSILEICLIEVLQFSVLNPVMRYLTVQWTPVSALMNRDKRCQQQRPALKDRLHYKAHNIPDCFVSDMGNMFPTNRFSLRHQTWQRIADEIFPINPCND
ncbi:hypothetical protein NPIL_576951 [Nephila pilipes]|uniref:Uncharacterized protein n=1 Tax=Nephila pilipes TaxID=299642 RepID=A0A8X6NBA5_NEPPI|nr:hypothetical protein NPIL_576951 [Nephila pilipes]